MKTFKLPDLGEGLPDAEIVEWMVAEGDQVTLDQPMVSMETAKAVVEVPSPYTGKIAKLYGSAGDVIDTGAPLVDFDTGEDEDSHTSAAAEEAAEDVGSVAPAETVEVREDTGTVVGQMESSDEIVAERSASVGKGFATPAVRALARKLGVDLARVAPTGKNGVITAKDVKSAAQAGTASISSAAPKAAPPPTSAPAMAPVPSAPPAPPLPKGEWTAVRGPRRAMARVMAQAHAQVVATTITEDADISAWGSKEDLTVRMLQGLAAASQAEPALNAWFDGDKDQMLRHARVDVGLAVDTEDGLFVPAVRDVGGKTSDQLRNDINTIRDQVRARSIPPEAMRDYTIMLSNVGVYAGRYTTPVITPPCVCIVAVGRARDVAIPVMGGFEARRVLPLSVTFDHRAVTGGEAARFLRQLMATLA